jgi:hypothetical protein
MGTKVIAVCVGTEPCQANFTVHEDLLRGSSKFFEAALGREWLESQERRVQLSEFDPETFALYVQWLYTGRHHTSNTGLSQVHTLTSGYVLGNYLQDDKYQDSLLDTLAEHLEEYPVRYEILLRTVASTYHQTTDNSPLRAFMIDCAVWKLDYHVWDMFNEDVETLTRERDQWPQEFCVQVMMGLSRRYQSTQTVENPFEEDGDPCRYHCHGDEPCYKDNTTRQDCLDFEELEDEYDEPDDNDW